MSDFACVIPIAGTGSRISELSRYIPKPMLPLSSKVTILDNILGAFQDRHIPRYLGMREEHRWDIDTSGKASYRYVIQKDDDDLVHNGFIDLVRLLQLAYETRTTTLGYFAISGDAVVNRKDMFGFIDQCSELGNVESPCVAVHRTDDVELLKKAGNAYCGEEGSLIRFKEKPKDNFAKHIACSMYYLPTRVVENLLRCVKFPNDELAELYTDMGDIIYWLTNDYYRRSIKTYEIKNYWRDVSDLNSYIEAVRIHNEGE